MIALAPVALAATACRDSVPAGAPLPASPPVIEVAMSDHRFDYDAAVPAGRVVFRFHNGGELHHDVDLFPLAEDVPPIDEQLRGAQRRGVSPFARVPSRPPGSSGAFAVDLRPGQRYAIICSIRDADGQAHSRKGMASEFRAGAEQHSEPGS